MKNKELIRRMSAVALSVLLGATATGCGEKATYDDFNFPQSSESSLAAVSNTYVDNPIKFEDAGTLDKELGTYTSKDKACTIKKMEHYYDVTLDYENHTPEEVGTAYAEMIMEVYLAMVREVVLPTALPNLVLPLLLMQ